MSGESTGADVEARLRHHLRASTGGLGIADLDAVLAATADRVRKEAAEEWVARLSDLCDDEWLRRRDRAMEAPGSKGHRWERRAASAWETAARSVRAILNDLADYENEYVDRHAEYSRWMREGRDEGAARIAREQAR